MRITIWHALVALAGLVILASAPLPHLDADTALYGRIAAGMLTTGDWLTLHDPGWLVDKPPVVFWAMAASFWLLGISDVTMRLWQLLLALLLMGVTVSAARAAGGSRDENWLAALVLGTALQFFYLTTVPQQDVPLTLFLTIAVYGLLRYMERGVLGWMLLSAIAVALAVLTKGLAGLALFAAVIVLSLALVRRSMPHQGRRLLGHALAGTLVFAVAAVPWYAHGVLTHGEPFVNTFLTSGTLGLGRFFNPAISSPPPYWISVFAYAPLLCLGLLPWTPAFLAGLTDLPEAVRRGPTGLKIVIAWCAGIFVLLSLSSGDKVFRYLLPCYPAAAILTGRALGALILDRRRQRAAGVIALVPAVALIAVGFWALRTAFPPERGLIVAVALPTVAMLAAGLAGFGWAALAGRARLAITVAALGAIIGYALFERAMLVHAAALNPWPAIAAAATPHTAASSRLILYGRVGEAANFARFHLDEPIVSVTSADELAALWERERVLVLVPAEQFGVLAPLRPESVIIHRSPAHLLLVANWPAGHSPALR